MFSRYRLNFKRATIDATIRPVGPSSTARCSVRIVIPALFLAVLAGCAPGPRTQVGPLSVEAVVSRPSDNRHGFTIEERIETDEEVRNNFDTAVGFMNRAQYAEAIDLLKKVIARSPGLTAPHVNIAIAYEQTSEAERAEEHLKTALGLLPGHPLASNLYGLLLRKNGRFSEARKIFETTLSLFPEYLPARLNFGILCELYLNDPETALDQYEIYSEAVPEDKKVKIWIASLRQQLESAQ